MNRKKMIKMGLTFLALAIASQAFVRSVAHAEAPPFLVPNILVCFAQEADGSPSKSATALKNPKLNLRIDPTYFGDKWFLRSGAPVRPNSPAANSTNSPSDISQISYVELLGLTWARNIQSGISENDDYQTIDQNLILPAENEDPLKFAIKIIRRLKYYSDDPNSGLYARIVRILTGIQSTDETLVSEPRLRFDINGMISDIAPLGNVAAGEKLTAELPDASNCVITSYSQQIEQDANSDASGDNLPIAKIEYDRRYMSDKAASIHSYQSRGLFELDQIMYYVSRNLFHKNDSDYTFILADLLRKNLTIEKLESDLKKYGFPRRDPLVLTYKKFVAASLAADFFKGEPGSYPNDPAVKEKWKQLLDSTFLSKLSTPSFSYVPDQVKEKVKKMMNEALNSYWQQYVVDIKSSRNTTEINIDVFFDKHVLPNFPADIIIPVSEK